jgi:hypothetical protein
MKPKRKRMTTSLDAAEMRLFKKVARYVRAYCGHVSRAEVLRYLVRDWSPR